MIYCVSTDRHLFMLKNISKNLMALDFQAHSEVRNYIISRIEQAGLETRPHKDDTAGDWGNFERYQYFGQN